MILKVATTFTEIIKGWRLVYQQYVRSKLIDMNPFAVFTYPQYIGHHSAVILGKEGNKSICSVSAVLDSKRGLPLDSCFQEELDGLRNENRKLIEIGLLANLGEKASPFFLIALLSGIARFGVYSDFHDYVIGVHPRRAGFFKQLFGFNQIGPSKKYAKLHESDVILLHADGQMFESLSQNKTFATYFEDEHLKFENRFRFAALASLKPFVVIANLFNFVRRLWNKFFPVKKNMVPSLLINDK